MRFLDLQQVNLAIRHQARSHTLAQRKDLKDFPASWSSLGQVGAMVSTRDWRPSILRQWTRAPRGTFFAQLHKLLELAQ